MPKTDLIDIEQSIGSNKSVANIKSVITKWLKNEKTETMDHWL